MNNFKQWIKEQKIDRIFISYDLIEKVLTVTGARNHGNFTIPYPNPISYNTFVKAIELFGLELCDEISYFPKWFEVIMEVPNDL